MYESVRVLDDDDGKITTFSSVLSLSLSICSLSRTIGSCCDKINNNEHETYDTAQQDSAHRASNKEDAIYWIETF